MKLVLTSRRKNTFIQSQNANHAIFSKGEKGWASQVFVSCLRLVCCICHCLMMLAFYCLLSLISSVVCSVLPSASLLEPNTIVFYINVTHTPRWGGGVCNSDKCLENQVLSHLYSGNQDQHFRFKAVQCAAAANNMSARYQNQWCLHLSIDTDCPLESDSYPKHQLSLNLPELLESPALKTPFPFSLDPATFVQLLV